MEPTQLAGVADVIRVALTPVFLISGIGTLLNVFNTRLARVSDHAEHVNELLKTGLDARTRHTLDRQLVRLHRRTTALDVAIAAGAIGIAMTCAAVFALFIVTANNAAGGLTLLILFGAALLSTIVGVAAFVIDTVLAWHGIRVEGHLPSPRHHTVKAGS